MKKIYEIFTMQAHNSWIATYKTHVAYVKAENPDQAIVEFNKISDRKYDMGMRVERRTKKYLNMKYWDLYNARMELEREQERIEELINL